MIRKSIPFIFALAFGLIGFSAYTLLSQSTPPPSQENPQNISTSIEQQKQLVIQYINESNSVGAKVALEQLINYYGNTSEVVPTVYEIAEVYRSKAQFASAITASQFILANYPQSEKAIWAQRSLAASYIGLKDYDSAKTASDKLITDYSNNPNIAQAVFEVGDTFCWFGKNKEAQELYQKVIDSWPGAEHSMWAQMGLAISYIADGNDAAARQATDRLAANYASNEKLPEALTYIAGRYVWSKKYNKGLDIYSYIIKNFPGNTWAEGAKFESAKVSVYPFIDANDEPNTLAAIDNLINGFKEKAELPAAVYDFAARVDWKNNYEPKDFTKNICQIIMERFPNTQQSILAQMISSRMDIISLIYVNDDENALAAIDLFITDYNSLENSADEVFRIAQKYYDEAMILKYKQADANSASKYFYYVVNIKDRIIKELPQTNVSAMALFGIAVIYSQELREYEKGIEYFESLLERYPEHENNDSTHYLICRYYELLKRGGKIEAVQADIKIENSLKSIIENYPNSIWYGKANYDLGIKKLNEGNISEAILFLERAHQESLKPKSRISPAKTAVFLGDALEKIGQKEHALQVYKESIDYISSQDAQRSVIENKIQQLEGENK